MSEEFLKIASAAPSSEPLPVESATPSSYEYGAFRLDVDIHQLTREGEAVPLGTKAFDTLLLLVRNRRRLVTKDELIKAIWPDSSVSEDSLTHTISAIRRAHGDDPAQPRYISTVARRGYRFVAAVTEHVEVPAVTEANASLRPEPLVVSPPAPGTADRRPTFRGAIATALIIAALALALVLAFGQGRSVTSAPRPLLFTQRLPPGTVLSSAGVLSPDGHYHAFVARDERSGRTQLWVRSLDAAEPRSIDGTDGAARPFWSPDSQSIGFFADSRVMRVAIGSGTPQAVTSTIGAQPAGGTWSSGGIILYADSGSLHSIPVSGGKPTTVLAPDRTKREVTLRLPQFLPDGERFLYSVTSPDPERAGIYLGALHASESSRLFDGATSAVTYAPGGVLIAVRDRVLLSQAFDEVRGTLVGEARVIQAEVSATTSVSAAAGGLLAFGATVAAEQLTWFDRSGSSLGVLTATTPLNNLTLSPDEQQVAGTSVDPNQIGIWLFDLERGVPTRAIVDGSGPVWSPDGSRIAFAATRESGSRGIYTRITRGGNEDVLLVASDQPKVVNDWSPDGRFIVYVAGTQKSRQDIWLLPTSDGGTPYPFLDSPANEIQAQVSPDGRWITYASDESGRWQVYLQSFPSPGAKQTVSVGGGCQPQWRQDGRELFFLAPDHTMMAVEISGTASLRVGQPKALFRPSILGALTDYRNLYAVNDAGNRFLVKTISENRSPEPLRFLVNWMSPGLE